MKKCSNPKCIHKEELQPLSNFHKRKACKKDGLMTQCKDCRRETERKRLSEKMKNPKYRKKRNEKAKENYRKNPEKFRESNKKWNKKNINYKKEWEKNNKDKRKIINERYKNKKKLKENATTKTNKRQNER